MQYVSVLKVIASTTPNTPHANTTARMTEIPTRAGVESKVFTGGSIRGVRAGYPEPIVTGGGGSGGRIRTYDQVINSHPLYH